MGAAKKIDIGEWGEDSHGDQKQRLFIYVFPMILKGNIGAI